MMRKKWTIYSRRLAAGLAGVLLCTALWGCSGNDPAEEVTPAEETAEEETAEEEIPEPSVANQVLEVGVLASDCSNPYVIVVYETFVGLAAEDDRAIAVEMHDGRGSCAEQQKELQQIMKKGADVLLADMAEPDREAEIAAALEETGLPVIYFHQRPSEELLSRTGSVWIGLSEEEETEMNRLIEKDLWQDETWWRQRAEEDGRELFRLVTTEQQ